MSYRELRNFTEIMRALGYPRLISMENFRTPNFELVADILYWMVKLYDPDTTISDRVEFENERVEFLTSISSLLAAKARLKLNTKKLYASDGKAVQELLKLATLLYKATTLKGAKDSDDAPPLPIKMQDVKSARVLASEITQSGAKLYDLLENEVSERSERSRALRYLDNAATAQENSREAQDVERRIRDLIDNTRQSVEDAKKEVEELDADQRTLQAKIVKRAEELERTEKRLKSLETVRPQFLEEAEKLEKELQRYYEVYVERQRNLSYLETELDRFRVAEEEAAKETEARLKRMREKLLKEEVDLMRGSVSESKSNGNNSSNGANNGGGVFRQNNANANRPTNNHQKTGSMRSRESSEDEEDDEEDDEDDEDDEELSVNERYQQSKMAQQQSNNNHHNSNANKGKNNGGGGGRNAVDDFLDDDDEEDEDEDEEDDEEDDRNGDRDGDFSGSDDF